MNYIIAVDIGGTQIRAALFPHEGLTPLKVSRIATQDEHTSPLQRLQSLIASIWPEDGSVTVISVAAPGPIDPYQGLIVAAPNVAGWRDFPLRQHLEDRFKTPVVLGNDANLAALGEWMFGAGQGHHYLLYLTISTGIGSGIIIDDRLLVGSRGFAAELGHVTVLPQGPLCGCGQYGHLEAVASGPAMSRWVQDQIAQGAPTALPKDQPITAKMISQAATQNDDLSIRALGRAGTFIGQALADFLHIFNPSLVIFGGGVSFSGAYLFDPIHAALRKHVLSDHYLDGLTFANAALGDNTGLMGALALGRTAFPQK